MRKRKPDNDYNSPARVSNEDIFGSVEVTDLRQNQG
jgi:hypothetical protein